MTAIAARAHPHSTAAFRTCSASPHSAASCRIVWRCAEIETGAAAEPHAKGNEKQPLCAMMSDIHRAPPKDKRKHADRCDDGNE